MIDWPLLVYPFFAETHPRRGRACLRPVVRVAFADGRLVVDALVDTGSEHVLADASLALAAGIDLDAPVDIEELGLGGGIVKVSPALTGTHPLTEHSFGVGGGT